MELPLLYRDALVWRRPAELENILSSLTKEDLFRFSKESRRFFEESYDPIHLQDAIASTIAGGPAHLPPRPVFHRRDALQCFLDEQTLRSKTPSSDATPPIKTGSSPLVRWADRLELETAKALCSLGFSRAGTFLWNRASGRQN